MSRCRRALSGRIELDPMSSTEFNLVVGAERIYTEQDDCFAHDWVANTLYINPAGGFVVQAWRKLVDQYTRGNVRRAIWTGFSVEQLCLLADELVHPLDYSSVIARKRISFVRHDGFIGSPSHGNYAVGLGVDHRVFVEAFQDAGRIGAGHLVTGYE